MKRFILYLMFALFSCISLLSCRTFHPMATDIPLMENKGDMHLDLAISTEGPAASFAYAPTSSLSLMGHIEYSEFQLAAGHYTHLGRGVFECYAGAGLHFGDLHIPSLSLQCNYGWNNL